jgi:hypothetical protein
VIRKMCRENPRGAAPSSTPIFLTAFLASVRSIFQSRAALELENLALRHQIAVLRRSAAKRLKLTTADRLLWICLSRLWHDWRSAPSASQKRSLPGIMPAFACSGPGRCGTADTVPKREP